MLPGNTIWGDLLSVAAIIVLVLIAAAIGNFLDKLSARTEQTNSEREEEKTEDKDHSDVSHREQ